MKYCFIFIITGFLGYGTVYSSDSKFQVDSLLKIARYGKQTQKIEAYRNLADIFVDKPMERRYLKLLYNEATKQGDVNQMLEALGDLCLSYIQQNQLDSIHLYREKVEELPDNDEKMIWMTLLNMRIFDKKYVNSHDSTAIRQEREKRKKIDKTTVYSQLENAYIIASALLEDSGAEKALPYAITAVGLSENLPLKFGYRVRQITMRLLETIYMNNFDFQHGSETGEKLIRIHTQYYNQYIQNKRPFYNINTFYIKSYSSLLTNARTIAPDRVEYYMAKIRKYYNKHSNNSVKYNYFLAENNYYLFKNDANRALIANDSLIKYAYWVAPENVPALFDISARIYAARDRYKEAFYALNKAHKMQDSLNSTKVEDQLSRLQIEYNVDKLNYEKSQLEIKSKRHQVFSLVILLVIVVGMCVYLFRSLKKERKMKESLRILKGKAEESENMKTAFINSICHEIRTPLNAIVGFTSLILDNTIDDEMKESFPEEIQRSTNVLTTLINSMLEVSTLDNSTEVLPLHPTNINEICVHEMESLKHILKPDIECVLELPKDPIIIPTHERYLGLVIGHLLDNANKFTEKGCIHLHFKVDKENNRINICIKDTGCGIPVENIKNVFERFIKLDIYKPGNGLGLYLCKIIVKRLLGEIYVDSTHEGVGTNIIISLPILPSIDMTLN